MAVDFTKVMDIIEYQFQNPELLKQAFTHSSYANERKIKLPYKI